MMNDLDHFESSGLNGFSDIKSLHKAKSMNAESFGLRFADERNYLPRAPSGLHVTRNSGPQGFDAGYSPGSRGNMSISEQKSPSFYSLDYAENNDQVRRLRQQERSLRPVASTSHLPTTGYLERHMNDATDMNNVLSSVGRLSLGRNDHHYQPDTLERHASGSSLRHEIKPMMRAQSMRMPPGFERVSDMNDFNVDTSLDEFNLPDDSFSKTFLHQEQKQLKRFVTFAGKLNPNTPFPRASFHDEGSDDEDVDVSVIEDEALMEMSGDVTSRSPPKLRGAMSFSNLRKEQRVTPPELKRIDSAQKMRKAFPKTMFDNVDQVPQHPVVRRINSSGSIKSAASTSTNASRSFSPNRNGNKPKAVLQSPPQPMAKSPPQYNQANPVMNAHGFPAQDPMNRVPNLNIPYNQVDPSTQYGYMPNSPPPHMGNQPNPEMEQLYGMGMPDGRVSPGYGFLSGTHSPVHFDTGNGFPMADPRMGMSYSPTNGYMDPQQNQMMQQQIQNRMLMDLMLKQNAIQQNMIQSLQSGSGGQPSYNGNRYPSPTTAPGPVMSNMPRQKPDQSPPFNDRNISSLLIRHKTAGYRPTLQELRGHVVEFSRDSHGSRLVQCLMEGASPGDKELLINEVLPEAVSLMQDLFGNYVLQNFLEHCNEAQREHIASEIKLSMNLLSFQPHGCRVVQRAIDIMDSDRRNMLLTEIVYPNEKVNRCAKDPHATHVLQKAVVLLQRELKHGNSSEKMAATNKINAELLEIIEKELSSDVLQLAVHPHACRLVQKVLGDCNYSRSGHVASMMEEIRGVFPTLSVDQHGNFILQHIIDHGNDDQKQEVQAYVSSRFLQLAQHKFGSHLVEKCLNCANSPQAARLVTELLAPAKKLREQRGENIEFCDKDSADVLLTLMKDPYANFVVQRAFDASEGSLRQQITREVQDRSEILSRFTYGRHILSHVNKN